MEELVLTFDIGTQSIRALLTKKDGSFLDKEQYSYPQPYFSVKPYHCEQKPNFYYDCLCQVSKALLTRNKEYIKDIIAITVTTIRDTVLCLDSDNKPLRDIIVWLDKRGANFSADKVPLSTSILLKIVDKYETIASQFSDSACNAIMQQEPEIWEKTAKYVYLSTYINYLLTGNIIDSIGSVIGHMPFDYKKRRWMGKNDLTRPVYDIPKEKLFDVVEPGTIMGYINQTASKQTLIPKGLPLIATGSDKGCETIGLSIRQLGKAAVSFGTSATIQIASERYIEPQPFMPAYPAAIEKVYNPEIQIYRGYWMLRWFIEQFCFEESKQAKKEGISIEELLNRHLKDVPVGCDGLMIQPYWTAGVATPSARGSMVGFNDRQSKYHIYRAIIEGINFELVVSMHNLEKRSGVPIKEIYVGGGGAKSDEIMQITADMFNLPVKRIQTHEASGLGSSLVAFVKMGIYKDYDEASKAMIHDRDCFMPNAKNAQLYQQLTTVYSHIYRKLEPTYKKEKTIFNQRGQKHE